MAAQTPLCDLGWKAPYFELPDALGRIHALPECAGSKGTVVLFICNHCPYVRSVIDRIVTTACDLEKYGVNSLAVMANDWDSYPEDAPDRMIEFANAHDMGFPYLVDRDQSVAKAYGAVCTPDFFGFNGDLELQYRGRLDESGIALVSGAKRELFEAMKLIAETGKGPDEQFPSMGCSIKWRENT